MVMGVLELKVEMKSEVERAKTVRMMSDGG
jgi:hypothetical protein